jgi:putative CocE/NonD family hydrolase
VADPPVTATPRPQRTLIRPTPPALPDTPYRASSFDAYTGYSQVRFNTWSRTSQYVTVRDGVRLAVDVLRPAVDGVPVEEPLPVVWIHTRLHRAFRIRAETLSYADVIPDAQLLLRHGYVVAVVDARGTGASFGQLDGFLSETEARDAYDITEWLAAQPWSTGRVGMLGSGYLAMTQLRAASQAPPGLMAIFPASASLDIYDTIYTGGVYRQALVEGWDAFTTLLDQHQPAPPVDDDPTGGLRDSAMARHRANWDLGDALARMPFRPDGAAAYIDAVNASGVAVYLWSGWGDVFVRDSLLWYANLTTPKKLVVGPWETTPSRSRPQILNEYGRRRAVEQLRWFDYWLKGIDNGVMAEPPIHYSVTIGPGYWTWETAEAWPPAEAQELTLYLAPGPTGSVASVNDGALAPQPPVDAGAADTYTVDLNTTSGAASRWDNVFGTPLLYPDMTGNDQLGLTYTTPAFEQDLTLTGSPVITVYVSTAAPDVDVYAYLEEVNASGLSQYVTEGVLRASHRAVAPAPYDTLGLPFHPSRAEDILILAPDEPVALTFDLLPASNVFNAGHRLRLTLTCADLGHTETLGWLEGAAVQVHRSRQYPSSVWLPLAPGR